MKKDGRIELRCTKKLPNGVIDTFTVIVARKDVNDATSRYRAMGYEVTKG